MPQDFHPVSGREGSQRPSTTNGVKPEIKLCLIVAAVSAVLAVAGIFLLQAGLRPSSPTPPPQSTSEPTKPRDQAELDFAGWQTYRNEEFGFEFEYPSEWKLVAYSPNTNVFWTIVLTDAPPDCVGDICALPIPSQYMRVTVDISDVAHPNIKRVLSSVPELKKAIEDIEVSPGTTREIKEESIGDLHGLRVSVRSEDEYDSSDETFYFFKEDREGKVFLFDIDGAISLPKENPQQTNKYLLVYDQILSTFRFVEQEVSFSDCTKPWPEGEPVITSIFPTSGPIGTEVEIRGCHLTGFEGDLDAVFVRSDGATIPFYGGTWCFWCEEKKQETEILMKVTVQSYCESGYDDDYGRYSGISASCEKIEAKPGVYKVYATAWGKKSNEVSFTITE